jgi:hypothetical protein
MTQPGQYKHACPVGSSASIHVQPVSCPECADQPEPHSQCEGYSSGSSYDSSATYVEV